MMFDLAMRGGWDVLAVAERDGGTILDGGGLELGSAGGRGGELLCLSDLSCCSGAVESKLQTVTFISVSRKMYLFMLFTKFQPRLSNPQPNLGIDIDFTSSSIIARFNFASVSYMVSFNCYFGE